ncbi:MAG: hypothetical protein MRERV_4c067 [Mycoplasmataceae bacterium RV_VA103A]|nr:MAG: hypothetical protein MRERV_11c026 [Mycoplasmataceae bacterium RV_VA103A]KLL05164.1 MAG: hypothetical protein MRERV_4c067 [Mycoplasmataceae bacterium RV_VA103A]
MLREEVIKEWRSCKAKMFQMNRKLSSAERLNKMIPKLEDKVNSLVSKNKTLTREKGELTDKFLTYQRCLVIVSKGEENEDKKKNLSLSGNYCAYPEWHDKKKLILARFTVPVNNLVVKEDYFETDLPKAVDPDLSYNYKGEKYEDYFSLILRWRDWPKLN